MAEETAAKEGITEAEVAGKKPELTSEQKQEVLIPDLSTDTFRVGDKVYKIRMLPIFYEKILIRSVGGQLDGLKENGSLAEFVSAIMSKLPEIVAIICYDQGAMGAKREEAWDEVKYQEIVGWLERVGCSMDLLDVVKRQIEKNRLMDMAEGLLAQGQTMARLGASLSTPS